MSGQDDAVGHAVVADGAPDDGRPVPRRVLAAFDALARHDALAADPLDGEGIQLALSWEWERAEHGIPEGIAREDLAAIIGRAASDTEPPARAGGEREEAA